LQSRKFMPITTIRSSVLIQCPKMVLQSHAQNPLILQAQSRARKLAEKVNFAGQLSDREKLHVLRRYPNTQRYGVLASAHTRRRGPLQLVEETAGVIALFPKPTLPLAHVERLWPYCLRRKAVVNRTLVGIVTDGVSFLQTNQDDST
jgi:hypothetical protein